MLPAIAILVAVAVTSTTHLLTAKFTSRWIHVLPVIVFAAACVFTIYRNADYYFKLTPVQACRFSYDLNPFSEAATIAEYLRQHTAPSDTIMVFGSEPEIYFYAHRHSASGYIYMYSLTEDQAYWSTMQKQMMQEVEANRPAYVVFVNSSASWLSRHGSPQVVAFRAWMDQYIAANLEEVGAVELADPESQYFWGDEVSGHHRPGRELIIYTRKG